MNTTAEGSFRYKTLHMDAIADMMDVIAAEHHSTWTTPSIDVLSQNIAAHNTTADQHSLLVSFVFYINFLYSTCPDQY